MLVAAKDCLNSKQLVYAASISTYGNSATSPKVGGKEVNP